MSWIVRYAASADTAAIAAVHDGSRRAAMPWLAVRHTVAETRHWIGSILLPCFTVRVAEYQGTVIGYSAFAEDFLEALYILPVAQGQGIGSRLLDEAKAGSADRLQLRTFQRNTKARQFYEVRGFRPISLGDGTGNDEGEPDVLYEWHHSPPRSAL